MENDLLDFCPVACTFISKLSSSALPHHSAAAKHNILKFNQISLSSVGFFLSAAVDHKEMRNLWPNTCSISLGEQLGKSCG